MSASLSPSWPRDLPPDLAAVADLSVRGRFRRVLFAGLGYLLAASIVPWTILLPGFVLLCVWEWGAAPRWTDAILAIANDPEGKRRTRLIGFGPMPVGSTFFAILPTALAATGHLFGVALACIWLTLTAMHVYTYHSRSLLVQATTLAPCVIGVTVGTVWGLGFSGDAVLVLLGLLIATLGAMSHATDRNRLLDEIADEKSARLAAEAADKAKMQFLSVMSHELRTPLNAVIGYAEIMRDDIDDGQAPRRDDAGRIISAGQHLLMLINEVLDMARLEADKVELRMESVEAGALLRDVGAMLQPMAAKNHNQIEVTAPAWPVHATLDRQRVMQCLLNLGSNACKFTTHGVVRISLEVRGHGEGSELIFAVSDNGCGIAETDLARLFQPFQQVRGDFTRPHDGAGLGLAITRKLARRMGGDVTAQSTPGEGSVFTVRVPRVPVVEQALVA